MAVLDKTFEVKVPASTANIGPGFDSFGLALPLYLTIRFSVAEKNSFKLIGDNLSPLPEDESNLIYQTMLKLFEIEQKQIPFIAMEIESEIPLSRGLGSSGTAIVGGLLAANQLLDNSKSKKELLQIATKIEGHPDNVAASLYGGFNVTASNADRVESVSFPFPDELKIVLAIPKYTLSTKVARGLIPENIPIEDAAFNIGHASLLLAYLVNGELDKIPFAMRDRLHQPYRQHNIKGLQRAIDEANKRGVFSAALSGAGPTILFFVQESKLDEVYEFLKEVITSEKVEMDILTLTYAKQGALIKALSES